MAHAHKANSFLRAGLHAGKVADTISLAADERHLRRKLMTCAGGLQVLVDFEKAVALEDGDALVLDNGQLVRVKATEEPLMEVRGRDGLHLMQLCWHVGNRHLEAQIEKDRILLRQDHVISAMLEGLGASLRQVKETFTPEHGAYHGHGHSH
jgi:urease accessory protein